MKVIALDPGVTTGYAIGSINEGRMYCVTGQEKWVHSELWGFLEDNHPDVLISERFEFRNRARSGLELFSRELIGIVHLHAQLRMAPPYEPVMQMPSVIGGHFTDNRLKSVNLYKQGKPHSNDACRHLLHWFEFGSGFQYNINGYEAIA